MSNAQKEARKLRKLKESYLKYLEQVYIRSDFEPRRPGPDGLYGAKLVSGEGAIHRIIEPDRRGPYRIGESLFVSLILLAKSV